MNEKELIKMMIAEWREEFNSIKEQLIIKGNEANTVEYSILATEALRLSLCMNDATDILIALAEKNNGIST